VKGDQEAAGVGQEPLKQGSETGSKETGSAFSKVSGVGVRQFVDVGFCGLARQDVSETITTIRTKHNAANDRSFMRA
jgi:hypothetical protein